MAAVDLLFASAPVPSPGPVALVFGDEGGEAPPGAVTVNAAGQVSGLRGQVGLLRGVYASGAGRVTGLRGSARVLTVPVVQVVGTLTGLRGMVQVVQGTLAQAVGHISGLRGRVELVQGVRVAVAGRLSGLHGQLIANYNINVQRPTVGSTGARWQDAQPQQSGVRSQYRQTQPLNASTRSHWQDAAGIAVQQREHWGDTTNLPHATAILFEQALRLPAREVRSAFQEALRLRHIVNTAFQQALRLPVAPSRQRFQETYRDRQRAAEARFQIADLLQRAVAAGMGVAVPLQRAWGTRYQQAWPPRPGIWTPPIAPPGPGPCYVPALPAVLVFADPFHASLPARLVFKCDKGGPGPEPGVVVPVQRVYIVLNNITLHRVDTGAELHAHSFGMSLDHQSWTWSWQASLHHDAAAHLGRDSQGDPAELAIMVNGLPFRLRLERVTRDRRFNPTRWGVSGKGKASILSAPYAPAMPFGNPLADRTAQQLMADVLTVNGVGIGWSLDWGLQDWLVPAGAWAMQGSYIDAINDIAAAAGGYVQPHPTDSVLRILPSYPAAPWDWGGITPDFEIPADAAEVEGTEYIDQPAYNRVFLGGVGAGVFGPFTRTGTAGDVIAPQVNHALITDAVAHRQRGVAELSNTGRQEHVTLNMQVLPETGVIVPGQFVRYLGDKAVMGIVRSTSIDWSFPKLRQTIKLETHA